MKMFNFLGGENANLEITFFRKNSLYFYSYQV